ncbi:Fic family protein [Piscirickettsia salmonis]|uniref:Fic family protein n=1 Tax=Piscirickettsia salmonis TaxID=1238 RepID=UPI0002FD3D22|nr:Fic family protein [Piscirickettsia salmonis]APS59089.1 cell filamentation protein Fic [Piscirickettsia salmonis]ERL61383.1 fic/DOC family protein [Piscirickettsia salmonis LF-89 = ATCC VR-1361]PEQ16283.1 Fic family protein [Piscirickettsia salmonis]QGN79235.1 mobile mystery protein B [Piscirickettsia salmonis]QGN82826.1 mobile mystery protein B [Piscirickettsia salmonis]
MISLSQLTTIERNDLFSRLRTSFTHHSNAIEGISLTFGETKRLLESGMTAGDKPLHEQLVVMGFADAFDFIIREANNTSSKLDDSFIKDVHAILFSKAMKICPERLEKPIGAWRTDERYIKGIDIKLSQPQMIDQDINNLLYQTKDKTLSLADIADFHIRFERIHPFADGNGRVGRLLIAYQAIKSDYIPPLILNDHRAEYLKSLSNTGVLEEFLNKAIANSYELVQE